MSRNSIRIPVAHIDSFKLLAGLPQSIIDQIVEVINEAPVGISETGLFDMLKKNITTLAPDKLHEIYSIYVSLSNAKENLELSDDDFFEDVEYAMESTNEADLKPTTNSSANIRKLFKSKDNIQKSRSFENESLENENNFSNVKIITDIRAVFEEENFLGTTIVNKIKITYLSGTHKKRVFLSVDEEDIENLISTLTDAKERNQYLKNNFKNLQIVDIIR